MYLINPLGIFILFLMLPVGDLHKILVITHLPIKSHAILNNVLVKLLLKAGHEVTQIAMIPFNYTHPKLTQIDVSYNEKFVRGEELELYAQVSKRIFTATLQHRAVDRLLRDSTQTFDLVVAEWFFNDICIGIAALYDCPIIWFSATESNWKILQLIEETTNTYTASSRSNNFVPFSLAYLKREVYLGSLDEEAYHKIFETLMALRGKQLRPYVELMYLSTFVLVYSRELFGDASKWPENFKPVAGYHISHEVKPLPKDLKSIMDNAKRGVIYFSLGSHLKSKDLPVDLKKKLVDIFKELKQIVLWKMESKLTEIPNNVHIMKWTPQQSILAHPNCLLFITQGGILSITEAVHFGVPIIGIPIFGDQFTNVLRAVKDGYGIKVDSSPIMARDLKGAIEEMLRNSSYREKVKQLSSIYTKRLMQPRVEIVHWINQAIRTGVPPHSHVFDTYVNKTFCINLFYTVVVVIIVTFIWRLNFMVNFKGNLN